MLLLLLLLFVELPGTWTARGGEWADRRRAVNREPSYLYLLYFAQPRRTSCLNPLFDRPTRVSRSVQCLTRL